MSTIFNTSYADSLRRINGEKREPQQAERKEKAPRTFADILAQKEERPATLPDARPALSSESLHPAPEPAVTNLTAIELHRMEEEPPAYRLTNHELSLEKSQVAPKQEKPRAPQPALPAIAQSAPKAPAMLGAKRVAQPLIVEAEEVPSVKISSNKGEATIEGIISRAGKHHGVDPALSIAVARAESSLRVNAVSRDGHASKGIFQLLDQTGKELMNRLDVDGHYRPFDAEQNAHLGVGYLRRLHDLFSKESNLGYNLRTVPVNSATDLEKFAVAAFNAGEGNVARAQRIAKAQGKDPSSYDAIEPHLPASTRAYVERVSSLKNRAIDASDEETLA